MIEELGRAALALITAGGGPDEATLPAMRDLATAAAGGGLDDLLEAVEIRTVDVLLARARGACLPPGPPGMVLTTVAARRYAAAQVSADLPSLPTIASIGLLDWVATAGVDLDHEALGRAGERIIGPAILHRPTDPQLRETLARWPAIGTGVVRYLDLVGGDELDRLVAAFGSGLAELLQPGLAEAGPGVRRAIIVVRVQSGLLDPVEALKTVLTDGQAGPEPPGDRLLTLLFGDRPWSLGQARRVLRELGMDRATAEPVTRRLGETVLGSHEDVAAHIGLCTELRASAVYARLSETARRRIDLLATAESWMVKLSRQRTNRADLVEGLGQWLGTLGADERRVCEAIVLDRLAGLRAEPRAHIVVALPGVRASYCAGLAGLLSRRNGDLEAAAMALRTFANIGLLRPSPPVRAAVADLDAVLRRNVGRWNGRTQQRLLEFLALDSRGDTVDWIRQWLRQQPPGIVGRMRGLWGRHDAKATRRHF
jgi:hypothetical protein